MLPHAASYNIEDDKLRFFPAGRLDKEDWLKFKNKGFLWAPSQDAFVQVWSPEREDLVMSFADEITIDDTEREERAVLRSNRFQEHAENAQSRAENADKRAHQIMDMIPFGQPILVGHHSERHARRDQERIDVSMRTFLNEYDKSNYWSYRAKRVIAHANYLDRADVRYRRIQKLAADIRKHEKEKARPTDRDWLRRYNAKEAGIPEGEIEAWIDNLIANSKLWHNRWIEHLTARVDYEREIYNAQTAGKAIQEKPLEKGGMVYVKKYPVRKPGWYTIERINKSMGEVKSVSIVNQKGYGRAFSVVSFEDIVNVMTKEEADACNHEPEEVTE